MMGFDSAAFILMAEGLVAALLLAGGMFFFGRNRQMREVAAVEQFVNQMAEEEILKNRMLESILIENCGIGSDKAALVLQEVTSAERALLHRVIQLFLKRDPGLLKEIDQLVVNLSDPYCKLMSDPSAYAGPTSADADADHVHNKLAGLERVNHQLVRQLDTAMQTIDEITAEYTRVFSGNQTALELENSSKKMLAIYQDVERQLKKIIDEPEL